MLQYKGQQPGGYRFVNMLGKGRLAEVYLGEHTDDTKQVAIKALMVPLTDQQTIIFRNLAPVLLGLVYPNIVRVHDLGIHGRMGYIVMDYAPNGSIRIRYPGGECLHPYTVVSYVEQIAAALHYAHKRGITHLDIRPANILLGMGDEALVSDFGIAHLYRGMHHQQTVGDARYMAPEQFRDGPCAASDQYALGIMAYEWLCGDCPFQGSFAELRSQHLSVPPPSLREKNPAISPAVQDMVVKALAKDPVERFASIRDFAQALELACISEMPLGANPTFTIPDAAVPSSSALEAQENTFVPVSTLPPTAGASPRNTHSGPRLSRRAMLAGLAGLAVVGSGVGVGWLKFGRKSPMGTVVYTYHGHSDIVYDAMWSPDGKRISSGSEDVTVQVWDAITGKNALVYGGHSSGVRAAAWSPNGKLIASGGYDRTVQIWDAVSARPLLTYSGHTDAVWQVAWSPNGLFVASASQDGTVQVWNATSGSPILTYRGHGNNTVRAVAWSPDGKRIASGGYDHTVQVWDAVTGSLNFTYSGHQNWVASVAWSPDGGRIASGGYDYTAQVWDARDGKHIYTYLGHVANEKTTIPNVNAVAWSPDGERILSASGDNTVQVWDATTGANAFIYRGHRGWVYDATWSPDGQLIASGGTDRTVQVWQAS